MEKAFNSTLSRARRPMKRSGFKPGLPKVKEERKKTDNKPRHAPIRKKIKPSTLKRKLDEIYSLYVRQAAADSEGFLSCYCGVRIHWKESDCSHYIPRGCLALRYDPRNTLPSCRRCNRFMGGNLQAYALVLQSRFGTSILQELERERQKITKNFPYEEMIEKYSLLLKQALQ